MQWEDNSMLSRLGSWALIFTIPLVALRLNPPDRTVGRSSRHFIRLVRQTT